ncbi:prepilin-type N-terminal cleavage/methylation domain-containing protein [Thiovulum sp. ES]|nr:prepilin-type N-terminal cleavage/methylation domain-containing protein [Thiovulum sp. ES]
MKRAFSMIELVFVIVILGILSVVAMPKFASVQDDALVSNEKATIEAVKNSIQQLHGKWLLRRSDFPTTIFYNGADVNQTINFSNSGYPTSLDFSSIAFGLVLDPEDVSDWSSTDLGNGKTKYIGPASSTVSDKNSEISTENYWEYDSSNGRIVLK